MRKMDIAMFQTPQQPPDRTPKEVFRWALRQATDADEAGFTEYLVGEHRTLHWESIPNPELVLAAAAEQTERVVLGTGVHLLPYHHPAVLAVQTAWLSHVLEGRYLLGVGAGAYPSDAALIGLPDISQNHAMMEESLEIMEMVWKDEPFKFEGKFWTAGYPEPEVGVVGGAHEEWRSLAPYGGKMNMALVGLSQRSPSIKRAGELGFIPMTVYVGTPWVREHWDAYEEGAAAGGHPAERSAHHILRDVFVAETDAEAKRLSMEGPIGRSWREYFLPTYRRFGLLEGIRHDPSVDVDDIDLAYIAEHQWIIGSPETVTEKLQEFQEATGGFGTLMIYSYDYADEPEPWVESMNRLAKEVAPQVSIPDLVA
jgi:3,6-diketocamphane 1,6-monooxygenase